MDNAPSLDIVIVNWNAGKQIEDCVQSVASARHDGFSIRSLVIVDNGSTDGSSERAAAASERPRPRLIQNAENRGFGAACNQGARASDAQYILFLNPDAMLFPESLARPVAFMESAEGRGVGACGVQLLRADGDVARSCARRPTARSMAAGSLGLERFFGARARGYVMTDWDHSTSADVDHVIGAFYLVRREAFEKAGGFDERFFVYLEDLDLSLRLKRDGWRVRFLANASAYHKGGGASEKARAARLAYSLESRIKFARKHFSPAQAAAIAALTFAVEPGLRLALAALEASPARVWETVGGYARLAASLTRGGARP